MLKMFQDDEIIKMEKRKITILNEKKLEEIKRKG
jgi:hypothetical protein